MNVRELIAELQKCDPEALVVTDGYEMGVQDLRVVKPDIAFRNAARPSWMGRFELTNPGLYTPEGAEQINVVYLPRCDDIEADDDAEPLRGWGGRE